MEQNILEGNKLIAEFMGLIHLERGGWTNTKFVGKYVKGWYGEKTNSGIRWTHIDRLDYSTDWNLLMPVVEKIEKLYKDGLIFHIKDTRAYIEADTQASLVGHTPEDLDQFYSGFCDTKLAAVYSTVLIFLTWYNTQIRQQ